MPKNNAFVAKIVNTHLTKIFIAIFALAERVPTFATLVRGELKFHLLNPDDSSTSVELEEQIANALVKAGVISCNDDTQCDDDKKVFVDTFKALSFSIFQFQPSI